MCGNFVMNTSFKVMDSSSVLGKFAMNAEVWDIANWNMMFGLFWLAENEYLVYT